MLTLNKSDEAESFKLNTTYLLAQLEYKLSFIGNLNLKTGGVQLKSANP